LPPCLECSQPSGAADEAIAKAAQSSAGSTFFPAFLLVVCCVMMSLLGSWAEVYNPCPSLDISKDAQKQVDPAPSYPTFASTATASSVLPAQAVGADGCASLLQCPAQLITERELRFKVFANANALVPDPAAAFLAEDEVRPWSEAERRIFMEKFTMHPKVPPTAAVLCHVRVHAAQPGLCTQRGSRRTGLLSVGSVHHGNCPAPGDRVLPSVFDHQSSCAAFTQCEVQ